MIHTLIAFGADVKAKNKRGETAHKILAEAELKVIKERIEPERQRIEEMRKDLARPNPKAKKARKRADRDEDD